VGKPTRADAHSYGEYLLDLADWRMAACSHAMATMHDLWTERALHHNPPLITVPSQRIILLDLPSEHPFQRYLRGLTQWAALHAEPLGVEENPRDEEERL
jgi:hypothetical protein